MKYAYFLSFFSFLILSLLGSCNAPNDHSDIDHALITITDSLRDRGKTDEIIELNKSCINKSKDRKYARGEALGYINIANIYAMIGQYNNGILYLNKAQKLITNLKDDYLRIRLFHEYAQMNYVIGLPEIALKYNAKSIAHARKIPHDSISRIFSNLYTVRADFIQEKHRDSTLIYFHKGLLQENSALNNALIGNYHSLELLNQDSARIYFTKADSLLQDHDYSTVRTGIVYSLYAHYLYQEERLEESMNYLKKAADILTETGRYNKLPFVYEDIIQISKIKGDTLTQKIYQQKNDELKNSLQSSANRAIDLALTDALRETENYRQKQYLFFFLLFSSASVLVAALLFWWWKSRRTNHRENGSDSAVSLSGKEEAAGDDALQLSEILQLAKENSNDFYIRFYEYNPQFVTKLYNINPDLSNADIIFCMMIWLGFSSKEIAQYSFIEHRSVQTKKSRLRKKLNLDSEVDLYKFIRELNVS